MTHATDTTTPSAQVGRRYDRIARFYDAFEVPMDLLGGRRRRVRTMAGGSGRTLEVGIGTGRTTAGLDIVEIDWQGIWRQIRARPATRRR